MRSGTPVLFIHGLWLHASSWGPWLDRFADAGYRPEAPGWPGDPETVELAREDPSAIAAQDVDGVVAHYAGIIRSLDAKPVLIGHSFGGMVAQKLLGEGLAAAAVAIDAAPIKGVRALPMSAMRATLPVLRNPANRKRAVSLTADQFAYAFGNALSREESDELHQKWAIPAPGKPLFQAAMAALGPSATMRVDTRSASRGPLLLVMGGQDHTVPPAVTRSTLKRYRRSDAVTESLEFPDRGHSLTIDSGWREVADASLDWLRAQGL